MTMPTRDEQRAATPETEQEQVYRWRHRCLREGGFDIVSAAVLATATTVDLHAALDLRRHGCPSETAVRILL